MLKVETDTPPMLKVDGKKVWVVCVGVVDGKTTEIWARVDDSAYFATQVFERVVVPLLAPKEEGTAL